MVQYESWKPHLISYFEHDSWVLNSRNSINKNAMRRGECPEWCTFFRSLETCDSSSLYTRRYTYKLFYPKPRFCQPCSVPYGLLTWERITYKKLPNVPRKWRAHFTYMFIYGWRITLLPVGSVVRIRLLFGD